MKFYTNPKVAKYREYLRSKKVDVLGAGISNAPLVDFLLQSGAAVTVRDKKAKNELALDVEKLEAAGVKFVSGENYIENIEGDVIFRTPGIRYDAPGIAEAIERGAVLTSEMEAFISLCPCKILAITGSDGKSTTSTLTAKILEASGHTVHLGGNIGRPLLQDIENIDKDDFVVIELSSFQLHTMNKFENAGLPFAKLCFPDGAVVTNVSPNHLNWHTDMEEYVESKAEIFKSMNKGTPFVANEDYPISADFAKRAEQMGCDVIRFSSKKELQEGFFLKYDKNGGYAIIRRKGVTEKQLLTKAEILLRGTHNAENYMAAIALTEKYASVDAVKKVAKSFGGVRHRLELCRVKDGVNFYNSSIDSSPSRTLAALSTFPPKNGNGALVLVMGGADKNIPFDGIGAEIIRKAKAVYLSGPTSEKIKEAIVSEKEYTPETLKIVCAACFDDAVKGAAECAVSGDSVLLSPACTSFDAFKNFEERGERFKTLVAQL